MKKFVALIFVTGTLFIAGCFTAPKEPAPQESATPHSGPVVTKWEYKTVVDNDASAEKLSQLGAQGWEVISFNPYSGVDGNRHIICLLKRPIQ